jgi:hypothetical protein
MPLMLIFSYIDIFVFQTPRRCRRYFMLDAATFHHFAAIRRRRFSPFFTLACRAAALISLFFATPLFFAAAD